MHKRSGQAFLVLGLLGVLMAGSIQPGSARPKADVTPPTLNLPVRGAFVLGSTISATEYDDLNQWPLETSLEMRTQWKASDPSGICGYRTRTVFDDSKGKWTAWGNQRSLTTTVSDYDDQEGGGMDKFWGMEVRTRDCGGRNLTTKFVRLAPVVYQQDGLSYRYGTMDVTTTGTWAVTKCACWSSGTAWKTSEAGARVDYTLRYDNVDPATTVPVGLVMERAPNRGKVRILVDGVRIAIVDTYAPTKLHRTVVWTGRIEAGTHTLSLVNVGTPGRPRIDVDALASSEIQSEAMP